MFLLLFVFSFEREDFLCMRYLKIKQFMCMHISIWVCACMCVYLQRPEEGIRFSGARVTGGSGN